MSVFLKHAHFLLLCGVVIYDDVLVGQGGNVSHACTEYIHLDQRGAACQRLNGRNTGVIIHKHVVELLKTHQGFQGAEGVVRAVNVNECAILAPLRQLFDLVVGKV